MLIGVMHFLFLLEYIQEWAKESKAIVKFLKKQIKACKELPD